MSVHVPGERVSAPPSHRGPRNRVEYLEQVAAGRQGPKKRQTTYITERNGGVHRQKAWRKVKAMLIDHGMKSARLYHLVLMLGIDDGQGGEVPRFQRALKAMCLILTQAGIRYRWRACVELDEAKGWHFHVFMLAESIKANPCRIINHSKAGDLFKLMTGHRLDYHLSPPKSDMHRTGGTHAGHRQNYAYIAGAEKLADCEEWLSYLVKTRSKPTDTKQIYFSSRDTVTKKDAAP